MAILEAFKMAILEANSKNVLKNISEITSQELLQKKLDKFDLLRNC